MGEFLFIRNEDNHGLAAAAPAEDHLLDAFYRMCSKGVRHGDRLRESDAAAVIIAERMAAGGVIAYAAALLYGEFHLVAVVV